MPLFIFLVGCLSIDGCLISLQFKIVYKQGLILFMHLFQIQYAKAYLSSSKSNLYEENLPKLEMRDLETDDDDDIEDGNDQRLGLNPNAQVSDFNFHF